MAHFKPGERGLHAVYRDNQVNHCPGCGRTHWYIGRTTAECAFCATALPIAEDNRPSGGGFFTRGKGGGKVSRMVFA
jgi:hypothetical protein